MLCMQVFVCNRFIVAFNYVYRYIYVIQKGPTFNDLNMYYSFCKLLFAIWFSVLELLCTNISTWTFACAIYEYARLQYCVTFVCATYACRQSRAQMSCALMLHSWMGCALESSRYCRRLCPMRKCLPVVSAQMVTCQNHNANILFYFNFVSVGN
jgi:hypothetical protein